MDSSSPLAHRDDLRLSVADPWVFVRCLWRLALDPKWTIAAVTYALSWLTLPLLDAMTRLNAADRVIIAGVWVPAVCGFGFVLRGVMQTLNVPGGRARGQPLTPRNPLTRLGQGLLGGAVGSVLGVAIGVVFCILGLALLVLLNLAPSPESTSGSTELLIPVALNVSVYLFGIAGMGVGVWIGAGRISLWALNQRLLVSAVIYSAMVAAQLKHLLSIPVLRQLWQTMRPARLSRQTVRQTTGRTIAQVGMPATSGTVTMLSYPEPDEFEVTESANALTLRCPTYRASDWVGMGFNGLYNGFALLIGAIALWRGTWATLAWAISAIFLLALLWTWYSLTRLCNYTTITLTPTQLTRQDAPLLSLATSVRIPLRQLATVQATRVSSQNINQWLAAPPDYQVCALLINGQRVPLLRHLNRWEDALFVEKTMKQFWQTVEMRI